MFTVTRDPRNKKKYIIHNLFGVLEAWKQHYCISYVYSA